MIEFRKLSEVAELTVGYVGTMGKHYSDEGVLFLRSLNVMPFSFDLSDIKFIPNDFNLKLKKSELHTNDVVIVRTGIPGTCAVIPPALDGCNCADLVIVRPNTDLIDPHFLCAFINSWGRSQIFNAKVGAVQKHFNISSAKDLLIPVVELDTQKKIADIVFGINTKIENNSSICHDLEALAKEIFDYWFVQFDFPDAEGKPYKSNGGKMVWSEELNREIPAGWKVCNLYDISNVIWGQCPDGKDILEKTIVSNNVIDYCSGAGDMRNGFVVDCQSKTYTNTSRRMAHKDAVLLSVAGSIGAMCFADHDISLGRAAVAFEAKSSYHNMFIYNVLKMLSYQVQNLATGSIQKVINSDHVNSMCFACDIETLNKYGEESRDIYNQLINCAQENQCLTELRDYILPLLMNGQVGIHTSAH